MAIEAAMIERLIKESLPDAQVSIEDLRGDGDHYAAHVISGAFRGKTRVQQHQMVYQALRGRMGNELHALALQTGAPEDKAQDQHSSNRGPTGWKSHYTTPSTTHPPQPLSPQPCT